MLVLVSICNSSLGVHPVVAMSVAGCVGRGGGVHGGCVGTSVTPSFWPAHRVRIRTFTCNAHWDARLVGWLVGWLVRWFVGWLLSMEPRRGQGWVRQSGFTVSSITAAAVRPECREGRVQQVERCGSFFLVFFAAYADQLGSLPSLPLIAPQPGMCDESFMG